MGFRIQEVVSKCWFFSFFFKAEIGIKLVDKFYIYKYGLGLSLLYGM